MKHALIKLRDQTFPAIVIVLVFCCQIFLINNLGAQGWSWQYGTPEYDICYDLLESSDDGFVLCGGSSNEVNDSFDIFILKTNAVGEELWRFQTDELFHDVASAIIESNDGDYVFAGYATDNWHSRPLLGKIDSDGNLLWQIEQYYPVQVSAEDLIETADNGYLILVSQDPDNVGLLKFDDSGNLEWDVFYDTPDSYYPRNITVLSDGNYLIGGSKWIDAQSDHIPFIMKVDGSGGIIWEEEYAVTDGKYAHGKAIELNNGSIVFGGSVTHIPVGGLQENRAFALLADANGEEQWQQMYDHTHVRIEDIVATNTGGFSMTGHNYLGSSVGGKAVIGNYEEDGTEIWYNQYIVGLTNQVATDYPEAILQRDNQTFAIAGYTARNGFNDNQFFLMATDSLGDALSNTISGVVYKDENSNCLQDSGEPTKAGWVVSATDGVTTYYGISQADGTYEIKVGYGIFEIEITDLNPTWSSCHTTIPSVEFTESYQETIVDLGMVPEFDCPRAELSISNDNLRRCIQNRYLVQLCNRGSVVAEDAAVEIELDPYLSYFSSSIPLTSQTGNLLRFEIGDLSEDDCYNFEILLDLDCDSTVVGLTHCVGGHAYPDTICAPIDGSWSGASLRVDGSCENNSEVAFTITNQGAGAMSGTLEYIVIEDVVGMTSGPFNLGPGGTMPLTFPANGSTMRLQVMQEPGHPGVSAPSVTIEGCGTDDNGEFSMGFVNQLPHDEGDYFIDIECTESRGSYDPNIKSAFPEGYDTPHFIEPNTRLTYKVQFQNTGNDTAFKVVILDTISSNLDLGTFRAGSATHDYRVDIMDDRVVAFIFDDILLPDSTTNYTESNGWVQFQIDQVPDLGVGRMINNSAAIYFDFNAPIITNNVFHTIGQRITVSVDDPFEGDFTSVKIFPNPTAEVVTFSLSDESLRPIVKLFGADGTLVKQLRMNGAIESIYLGDLPAGQYYFELSDGKQFASGKIILH